MAARRNLFKRVPLKKRNPLIVLLSLVVAITFIVGAVYLWHGVSIHSGDGTLWVGALFFTLYALFSSMAVITGEGAWLILGLYWGAPAI